MNKIVYRLKAFFSKENIREVIAPMLAHILNHRSSLFFRFNLSLFLILALTCPSLLKAQTLSCTGPDCPPAILNDIGPLGDLLEQSFGRKLAGSFSEAHAISNVGLIPHIGSVGLNLFTAGVQLSLGREKSDIGPESTASGSTIENPGFGGILAQGLVYGGMNLGILSTGLGLGNGILDPIDIYFAKADAKLSSGLKQDFDTLEYDFDSLYFGLRYKLIESIGIFIGGWHGLSFHIGRIATEININLEDEDEDPSERFTIAGFNWQATTEMTMESEASTTVIELNTGIGFLFIDVSLGAGLSYHSTETSLSFKRKGNLYSSGKQLNAVLDAEFKNRNGLEISRRYYMKMGIEFTFLPFSRIGIESVYSSKDLYSISLGTRVDI